MHTSPATRKLAKHNLVHTSCGTHNLAVSEYWCILLPQHITWPPRATTEASLFTSVVFGTGAYFRGSNKNRVPVRMTLVADDRCLLQDAV